MDEHLDDILRRMNVRNLARIQSGCERDGDIELAEIVAARIGDVSAPDPEAPAISV